MTYLQWLEQQATGSTWEDRPSLYALIRLNGGRLDATEERKANACGLEPDELIDLDEMCKKEFMEKD